MKYEKKFIDLGGSNTVVVPDQWVKMAEKESGRKMFGVLLEVNNLEIRMTPMWEEKTLEKLLISEKTRLGASADGI